MKRAVIQKSFAGASPLIRNKTENDSIASLKALGESDKPDQVKGSRRVVKKHVDLEAWLEIFYSTKHGSPR